MQRVIVKPTIYRATGTRAAIDADESCRIARQLTHARASTIVRANAGHRVREQAAIA
jgi:hypothetical protein